MREHAQGIFKIGQRLAKTGFVGEAKDLKIYSGFYKESAWEKCDILCSAYLVPRTTAVFRDQKLKSEIKVRELQFLANVLNRG